ncbi:MAG: hypothetical protein A2066_00120 [Bacteroidetes bacterium GWB2_41_8]|nr:MAG: hypothetical protein A2066_00120 [Bacteroidetes bacterium GWB2_41_8]
MSNLSEYEKLTLIELGQSIVQDRWSNEGLVQLIELAGGYLNLQTIPDYAAAKKLSYNGVKKTRNIREIHGIKWVIDNN